MHHLLTVYILSVVRVFNNQNESNLIVFLSKRRTFALSKQQSETQ